MKITIIVDDKAVYQDGVSYGNLDFQNIPNDIHAVQFDTNFNCGWIEYSDAPNGQKLKPNEEINALPDWALQLLDLWTTADLEAKAAAEQVKNSESTSAPIQESTTSDPSSIQQTVTP